MSVIGQGISLRGMNHEKFHYPFYLASGITSADEGKAVAVDPSAANTVKLAGDGDIIVGKLVIVEDRSIEGLLVGTVALRGGFGFTPATGAVFSVGDTAVGAGNGEVKPAATANHSDNIVVEIESDGTVVVVR